MAAEPMAENSTIDELPQTSTEVDSPGRLPDAAARRRLAALVDSGLLDSEPEAAFDRFTRMAKRIVKVPVALVSLVTDDRQFFKSQAGLTGEVAECRGTPISGSFCKYVLPGEPLIVTDAREHPIVRGNPSIEKLGVIAYAGFPIRNTDGLVFGAFCAIDDKPRQWTEDEIELLAELAAAVSSEIKLRERLLREHRQEVAMQVALTRLRSVERDLTRQVRHHEETAAMVSHDLRTPLSALLLSAGLLEREDDQARRSVLVQRMRNAIRDMDHLVGDLMDVVRINAGTLKYRFTRITAGQLFEHLRDLHGLDATERKVELTFEGDPTLVFGADEPRLVQALSNLIGNAMRAISAGGTIAVAVSAPDADSVVLEVRDDGPGIAPSMLEALFDRYVQGDRPGGAGLGLSIARGIAQGHRGSLSAESEVGKGATFRMTIPSDLGVAEDG